MSDFAQLCGLYSPPGSSIHGILQARILKWVAISSSRGSSWPRDWTQLSYTIKLKSGLNWKTYDTLQGLLYHQFSSVQSLSRVRLFATPWIAACQASLSITNSQSSLRLMSIESVMPSSHLILCGPLLLLPPIPPSIRVFFNESTLRMRWPKYWSFSFSIIPSKEIPGLISLTYCLSLINQTVLIWGKKHHFYFGQFLFNSWAKKWRNLLYRLNCFFLQKELAQWKSLFLAN